MKNCNFCIFADVVMFKVRAVGYINLICTSV